LLRSSSEAASVSIRVSRESAAAASVAVGTVVQVAAEATGWALSAGGRLLTFIPNEIGRSLLYHSEYGPGN